MTDLGVMIRRDTTEPTLRSIAQRAEDLGFRGVWINHPPNQDAFGPLSWAAEATTRVRLGVGVVPLAAHSPTHIMQRVKETGLPEARLRLGVGSGSSQRPLSLVSGALAELRSMTSSQLVVAALGPRMCELAGREADAVLLNAATPAYARESAERAREAAHDAGRPTPRVYALISIGIGDQAAELQRRAAAFYAQLPAYRAHFARMGVSPEQVLYAAQGEKELAELLGAWSNVVDEVVVGAVLPHGEPADAEPILSAARQVIH
jgi:alkanesulfonate monooxygenase SsuD/methylene tetrahydromethanopterin reductase-like flavin-dependent oxidoreductase (luciferase family)